MEERHIIHDKENQEFILPLENGLEAKVIYSVQGKTMRLTYSEVPTELRGKGIGKELVEKTFQQLTDEGYEAIAICSYISLIARRSPKWSQIIN